MENRSILFAPADCCFSDSLSPYQRLGLAVSNSYLAAAPLPHRSGPSLPRIFGSAGLLERLGLPVLASELLRRSLPTIALRHFAMLLR